MHDIKRLSVAILAGAAISSLNSPVSADEKLAANRVPGGGANYHTYAGATDKSSAKVLNSTVNLDHVAILQPEDEVVRNMTSKQLGDYIAALIGAADRFLSIDPAVGVHQLVLTCTLSPGHKQTLIASAKPAFPGTNGAELDALLHKTECPDVTGPVSIDVYLRVVGQAGKKWRQASEKIQAGEYVAAVALLKPLADDQCKDTHVFGTLGLAYKFLNQLPDAETVLRQAVQIDPQNFNAWLNLSNVLRDLGKLPESEVAVKSALDCKMPPNMVESIRANVALHRGDWVDAETHLRSALKLTDGKDGQCQTLLGYALRWQGKDKDAIEAFNGALALNPIDYDRNLADRSLAVLTKDWVRAESMARKTVKDDSKDYDAWFDLGLALKAQGNLAEAKHAFESAKLVQTPAPILAAIDEQLK